MWLTNISYILKLQIFIKALKIGTVALEQ